MNKNLDLYVATYANAEDAKRDLQMLQNDLSDDFKVTGAIAMSRDKNGKVSVVADAKQTATGARVGAGAGLVVGLFSPPLLGATAIGAGIGSVLGQLTKKYEEKKLGVELGEYFPPDSSAVAVVMDDKYRDRVQASLKHAKKRINKAVDSGDYESLWKALEKSGDEISGALES